MIEIKILESFPSTHYGYLTAGETYPVNEGFAKYAVDSMKAAEYVIPPTTSKPDKKDQQTKQGKK